MANIVGLKTKDDINMSVLKVDNNAIKIFDYNSGQYVPSPFGKNCIQYSYGYQPGEILYVLTYYESQNFATHDLKKLLTQKTINPSTINGAIAIGFVENVRSK